ncbi:GNAT family N-acetyltransferase [Streptomyces kronopolitis]|uniref:GNAT family N-acetyltransferase n=1 Tax=Streptomyces kronopolitis TaxID=1612435 RepID=UPI00343E4C3B
MAPHLGDIPDEDLGEALDLVYLAFHLTPTDKTHARYRQLLRNGTRIGARDGGRLAGVAGAHRLTLSVPGGQLPCAVLDFVSVAPTHRRRGVLTSMIGELWRRCEADGQPLACLWASESAIYGRYGFAAATETCRVEIDSSRPLALRLAADRRPLRLIDPAAASALLAARYDASLADRAGRFTRDETWWRAQVLDLDGARGGSPGGFGPVRVVALGAEGETPGGYALYRTRPADDDGPGAVAVAELEAESAPAAAALWSYLAAIDLTSTVRIRARPADDLLLYLAADRDQVRVTGQQPCLWLRLVDVRAALTARSWAAPVTLVLDLGDGELPANAGRFRLTATPAGATWEPTGDDPDLSLDVRELGAAYLGGTPLRRFAHAGLVTEHTPGAVRRLDAALQTDRLPFTADND